MNGYVMKADGVQVIEGAGSLEFHPDQIVLIQSDDPERRPLAAVKLSDRLWVAIGEQPPARWRQANPSSEETPATPVGVGDGGWPFEPPPDVDSEG